MTVRIVKRRIERGIDAAHGGLTALRNAGIVIRTETGQVEPACEGQNVEFLIQAAQPRCRFAHRQR